MTACRSILTALFCVVAAICSVTAQTRILPEPADSAETITVSLITCAPGGEVYELEGHSGLRLQYSGYDYVVNWGLFDFNSPGFVFRFVKGETDYCVGTTPTSYFLGQYAYQNRTVTEQTLNLTPDQSMRLLCAIDTAMTPMNRTYRYNYVYDNCSIRPLRYLEEAIGTPIKFGPDAVNSTFRREMTRFHANYPWYQFGIDIALGSGIDKDITLREALFAPVTLCQEAASAQIQSDGQWQPLVKNTAILYEAEGTGAVLPATPWWMTPMAVMSLLLILSAVVSVIDIKLGRQSKWFDAVLFCGLGLTGIVVAFLVFISVHEATTPNWNLLWLNPLALLVPALMWWRRFQGVLKCYHWLNLAAIATMMVVAVAGLQVINMAFVPLMLADALRSATNLRLYREAKSQA